LGAKTITLFDTKGARAQPRVHVVPLADQAMTILAELAIRAKELHSEPNINPAFLFTSDGKRPLRLETVSSLVNQTAAKMLQAQELRDGFELRDVRRTCETMLAATGVSTDIRAQIQSHGLGGIQARHYNRHNYMEEKRAELQKWERHIARLVSGAIGEIIPMKRYS
jgi:integrase